MSNVLAITSGPLRRRLPITLCRIRPTSHPTMLSVLPTVWSNSYSRILHVIHPIISSVRSVSDTVSHALWKRESLQVSHGLSNGPQINAKLVLAVLSAASPLVARLPVKNTKHGEVGQVIVYPPADQRIDLRVISDRPVTGIYLSDPSWRLFFKRERKTRHVRTSHEVLGSRHPHDAEGHSEPPLRSHDARLSRTL